MSIIDIILVVFCTLVCAISMYTDIRIHKVKNILVLPMSVVGVALNSIGAIRNSALGFFVLNYVTIILFSVIMYSLQFWSAGDSKLLLSAFSLVPYELYYSALRGSFGSIAVIMFIFIVAFVYLLIETMVLFIKHTKTLSQKTYKASTIIWQFCLALFRSASVITIINIIYYYTIPSTYQNNQYVFMLVNFFVVYIINKTKVLHNALITVGLFLVTASLVILTDYYKRFVGSDYKMIIIFASIIIIRYVVGVYNYKCISVDKLCSGMILSAQSSVILKKHKIIDYISDESLKYKISEEECERIIKETKKREFIDSVFVLRTIPFATLISLGVMLFLCVRIICIY